MEVEIFFLRNLLPAICFHCQLLLNAPHAGSDGFANCRRLKSLSLQSTANKDNGKGQHLTEKND